ncbi:hypothetical protein [uncultured Vagococcus sp.]|uniref:hypothetical protein n=1 Tax=uncultured Vagococcus sp. TaxID=189676 RepID=UPI0028CFFA13|nr:hypothetical protein [uncultured Vagococcus sp.]
MKDYLIKMISEGRTIVFVFDKFNSFSADKVVDVMETENELLVVGQVDFKRKALINLLQVNYIRVVD